MRSNRLGGLVGKDIITNKIYKKEKIFHWNWTLHDSKKMAAIFLFFNFWYR